MLVGVAGLVSFSTLTIFSACCTSVVCVQTLHLHFTMFSGFLLCAWRGACGSVYTYICMYVHI